MHLKSIFYKLGYPECKPDIPEAETYSRSEVYRCIETHVREEARDLLTGKLERKYSRDEWGDTFPRIGVTYLFCQEHLDDLIHYRAKE